MSEYDLIHKEEITRREAWSFAFRLMWAVITTPILAYEYLRAMRLEGYQNPRMLWQAIRLRLGRNAVFYDVDPLQPKQVGRVVHDLRSS